MHSSTIAAILAFTVGMTVNAVPVVRPEGTPEPPADRLRTTLENSGAQPQLSELAENEFTTPSVGKRDHPYKSPPACGDMTEISIGIPCISSDLTDELNRQPNPVSLPGAANARVIKRDPQRRPGNDDRMGGHLGIPDSPTLEELLDREKQAGFRKEKRQSHDKTRPLLLLDPNAKGDFDDSITIDPSTVSQPRLLKPGQKKTRALRGIGGDKRIRLGWDPLVDNDGNIINQKEKRDPQVIDAGFGFDAGVAIDPSAIADKVKHFIPGQKEKRDPQPIDAGFGFNAGATIPSSIADKVKHFIPGQKEKRDPQVVDAGFGFDAGVTIPSSIADKVKHFIPGQKERRDPQPIDAGFGFNAGVTIPSSIADKVKHFIPGQKEKRDPQRTHPFRDTANDDLLLPNLTPVTSGHLDSPLGKRDPQINAGFGFDADVTIDPVALPGHIKKLLPGQKTRRDAQLTRPFRNAANLDLVRNKLLPVISSHLGSPLGKRDPQTDAGFGFNAGINIDPIALPGHIKKLLPGQKAKRDPQNRGKGHVIGKIAEGVAGGIGAIADGFTIHQALQGKQA
ncbi:hypothetical protein BM1_01916 [Bipolaris maydis]|nr:hypothetical protein BM1_01916 [Bipolaris maydis]